MKISKLESTQRGSPLLLGKKMDVQVQKICQEIVGKWSCVKSRILVADEEGIVRSHDRNLFQKN